MLKHFVSVFGHHHPHHCDKEVQSSIPPPHEGESEKDLDYIQTTVFSNISENEVANHTRDRELLHPERRRKQGHTVYRLKRESWIEESKSKDFDVKAERRERRKARDDSDIHNIEFVRPKSLPVRKMSTINNKYGHLYQHCSFTMKFHVVIIT